MCVLACRSVARVASSFAGGAGGAGGGAGRVGTGWRVGDAAGVCERVGACVYEFLCVSVEARVTEHLALCACAFVRVCASLQECGESR